MESFSHSSHTYKAATSIHTLTSSLLFVMFVITLEGSISVLIQHVLKNGESVIIYLK